jgi:hypothetical protein
VTGSPPDSVRAGGDDPFSVVVNLNNMGEHEIPKDKVTVTLTGFDPYEFGTTPENLTKHPEEDITANRLDPDTKSKFPSSPVEVAFDLNYVRQLQGASNTFPVVANICYSYETLVNAQLCLKKKLTDTTNKDVCEVIGPKDSAHAGAPVFADTFAVTAAGKSSIRFTFKVKTQTKTSSGAVYKLGSSCSANRSDEDKVFVSVDTGIEGLSCPGLSDNPSDTTKAAGTIKLINGEKDLSCTQALPSAYLRDQIKVVKVELQYDYLDFVRKDIVVTQTLE